MKQMKVFIYILVTAFILSSCSIQKRCQAPELNLPDEIIAGETITLCVDVYNNGSKDISSLDVEIIDSNGNTVDSCVLNKTLKIGGSTDLEIPFVLPQSISRMDYTLRDRFSDNEQ